MQRSALCRSRRELSNEYLLAKFGFDTAAAAAAENEPCKVCPLSAYRSPRFVQMSAIPYYEGSADLSVAGGFVSLGTAVALLMGLLSMLVCMAFARPLLRWLLSLSNSELIGRIFVWLSN